MISAYIGLIEQAPGPACRVVYGYERGAAPNRRSEGTPLGRRPALLLGRCKSTPRVQATRAMAPVPASDGACGANGAVFHGIFRL
jgi:hypothetical protein